MNEEYYKDKVAIVTGGNSGIGYALCEELANRGAIVYMLGRNPDKVSNAINKIGKDNIYSAIADVAVKEQVQDAINNVHEKEGRIDFLINNAGIGDPQKATEITLDDWERMINTNLWSVIYGIDAVLPIMVEQDSGHIINTASLGGLIPKAGGVMYATTKFGVVGLTESLRFEFHDKNIDFSTICPGVIITEIFLKDKGELNNENSGELLDELGRDKLKEMFKDFNPIFPDEAAIEILDRISEKEGVIIVPKEPWSTVRLDYVHGSKEAEKMLLNKDPKQTLKEVEENKN